MIIELIIALLLGCTIGTFTGLIPGIHINLISVIVLYFTDQLLNLTTPLTLVIFIVSMSITHTFLDFIPSIFLGAPDEDSFLSILPGHQLLLKGRGYFAVVYTLYGSLTSLIIIIIFTPLFILLLPFLYLLFQKIMWIILITVSGFLIFSEEKSKRLWALLIFLLAGFLGTATLNFGMKEPLLPLLTGLFGASGIIISIKQKTKVPKQKVQKLTNIRLNKKSLIKSFFASIVAAPFTAFLPGLGASQAAMIGKQTLRIKDQREFLFLLGAINTIVMGLSFITIYSINKTRTGSAVAISKLLPDITLTHITLILFVIVASGLLSFVLAINLSKLISKNIHKYNYSKISLIVLFIILIIVLGFSDTTLKGKLISLLILMTSTSLGVFTIQKRIKRMHLMGCLLVPTIFFVF